MTQLTPLIRSAALFRMYGVGVQQTVRSVVSFSPRVDPHTRTPGFNALGPSILGGRLCDLSVSARGFS